MTCAMQTKNLNKLMSTHKSVRNKFNNKFTATQSFTNVNNKNRCKHDISKTPKLS